MSPLFSSSTFNCALRNKAHVWNSSHPQPKQNSMSFSFITDIQSDASHLWQTKYTNYLKVQCLHPKTQTPFQTRSCFQHFLSYQFPLQRVDLLHHPRVQFDGISDVGQHLFIGVGCLLVEQDPHSLAGLDAAPHHSHQLWPDEVLELAALLDPSLVAAPQGWRPAGGYSWGLDVDGPVGVDIFGVVQLFVGFNGAADVAFTFQWGKVGENWLFTLFVIAPLTICQSCPWLFSPTFFHPRV